MRKGTALHAATLKGYENVVDILLKSQPDIDKANDSGQTPLHYAAKNENDDIHVVFNLLKEGADWAQVDNDGAIPLHMAAVARNPETIKVLLAAMIKDEAKDGKDLVNKQDVMGRTPLYRAAYSGHTDIVQIMIDHKANVKIADKAGRTPLHAGADVAGVVKSIIAAGADINARDNDGWTPLMRATSWEKAEGAGLLLGAGANVNLCRQNGSTALHIAVEEQCIDILDMLLQHDMVAFDVQDVRGCTAVL